MVIFSKKLSRVLVGSTNDMVGKSVGFICH